MRTLNGPVPGRIARLPKDRRGYPIPFFVAWQDGLPLFPVADPVKMRACHKRNLCWICGETLGAYKAFAIGPMCCVNRISSEPPSHVDCAKFACANCPFMTQPLAKRADATGSVAPGGIMIERNPGVTAIWVTKSFKIENHGGALWRLGPATSLQFWARGRLATRAEVADSIETGLPILFKTAAMEGGAALAELSRQIAAMTGLLDTEVQWPSMPDVDLSSFEETAP